MLARNNLHKKSKNVIKINVRVKFPPKRKNGESFIHEFNQAS